MNGELARIEEMGGHTSIGRVSGAAEHASCPARGAGGKLIHDSLDIIVGMAV